MDSKKITLAITTRNEYEKLLQCFEQVLDDVRVQEIVIIDDKSNDEIYNKIEEWYEYDADKEKIRLGQNEHEIGEKENEQHSILLSNSDFVLSVNSDSVVTKEVIDGVYNFDWNERTNKITDSMRFCNRNYFINLFKTVNS